MAIIGARHRRNGGQGRYPRGLHETPRRAWRFDIRLCRSHDDAREGLVPYRSGAGPAHGCRNLRGGAVQPAHGNPGSPTRGITRTGAGNRGTAPCLAADRTRCREWRLPRSDRKIVLRRRSPYVRHWTTFERGLAASLLRSGHFTSSRGHPDICPIPAWAFADAASRSELSVDARSRLERRDELPTGSLAAL